MKDAKSVLVAAGVDLDIPLEENPAARLIFDLRMRRAAAVIVS